jgi:hypothetical protein
LREAFELFLEKVASELTASARVNRYTSAPNFETAIRRIINDLGGFNGMTVDLAPKAQVFPDIKLSPFGIEVKFTENDTWRSVANSVFEGTRSEDVEDIYVIFGKMGGAPEARWGRYEDVVMHVRTSHVPRFELEMGATEPLFAKFGIPYPEFAKLGIHEKMVHIRAYARGRLREGERLWWLDEGEDGDDQHTLPLQVRLYMHLPQEEKRRLRAEGALLCPQICAGSRARTKYSDVVMYILTVHGVLCPQARDLFSAGSVALRADETRGGKYIARALMDIEKEMRVAARDLDDALFVEYWGRNYPVQDRIRVWLKKADEWAAGQWMPSEVLFTGGVSSA